MTREELIQVGVDALPLRVWRELMMEDVVEYVLDAVEPLIRADERKAASAPAIMSYMDGAVDEYRDDLRAKVEAMDQSAGLNRVWRSKVLAMLGGSTDV